MGDFHSPIHRHSCDAYDAGGPCSCQPYLTRIVNISVWNPCYPQHEPCVCGHPYYRHFDWAEDYAAVGCKYCGCRFEAQT